MNPKHQEILAETLDLLKEKLPGQAVFLITIFNEEEKSSICSASNMTVSGQMTALLEVASSIVESELFDRSNTKH